MQSSATCCCKWFCQIQLRSSAAFRFRAPPTTRMDFFSAGELRQLLKSGKHVDANKIVSFHIDGGTRALKNRRSIHLFCQKENFPAGVYKNLAIRSCAAVLLEQLTRLKANLLKLRRHPGIAELLPWSSGKHPNSVVYTNISLVPRSFVCVEKRELLLPSLLCNEVVILARSRCFCILSGGCQDQCVAHCSLFKVCSDWT